MVQPSPDGSRRTKTAQSAALKTAAMRVREEGFKVLVAAKETALPAYDSFRDPYCPWALALEHNIWQDRHAGALLEGAAPHRAASAAQAETAERLLPLRERVAKDRWTLPTMPLRASPAATTRGQPPVLIGTQGAPLTLAASGQANTPTRRLPAAISPEGSPQVGAQASADDAPLKLSWQESRESAVRFQRGWELPYFAAAAAWCCCISQGLGAALFWCSGCRDSWVIGGSSLPLT